MLATKILLDWPAHTSCSDLLVLKPTVKEGSLSLPSTSGQTRMVEVDKKLYHLIRFDEY